VENYGAARRALATTPADASERGNAEAGVMQIEKALISLHGRLIDKFRPALDLSGASASVRVKGQALERVKMYDWVASVVRWRAIFLRE
jgi:hypothetical protein